MLDLAGGLLVAILILLVMGLIALAGVIIGLIYVRIVDGKYVDPSKIRHCKDIKDV